MKRLFLFISIAVLAFILGWFANDAFTFSKGMQNDRYGDYLLKPKNVPSGAFWAGGVDGGNWFLVKQINTYANEATIEIYNDQNGSLISSKTFTLICSKNHSMKIDNLKDQITAFDGANIQLTSRDKKTVCQLQ